MYHKFLPVITISFVVLFFFHQLFIPTPKLYATPDFGQSDIWSLNLPAKKFLSESLGNNEWPLWNPYIANGYPQLAEGQIGTFYIPNLVLFKYLPFVQAYNIGYIVTFFIAAYGMYLFVRSLKFEVSFALFASLLFAFSGYFATHISHYNLLQTSALFPWIFYAIHKAIHTKKPIYCFFYAFLLSQQIFTGFPQTVLITLFGSGFFAGYMLRPIARKNIKIMALLVLCTVFAFILSTIQLLPQSQFLKTSTRDGGLPSNLSANYSFPFPHLATFLFPTILGTPQDGSYQMPKAMEGIIFWENIGFIGLLPFLLALCSVFFFKKNRYIQCFIILTILSLLLMTGKYSPLYLIYSFPPLTFFRVPSRFILPFFFSCIILSLYVLKYIRENYAWGKLAGIFVMFFSLYQVLVFAYQYNPTINANELLKDPPIKKIIKNPSDKIISIGSALYWNDYFYTKGWKNPSAYLQYKNALSANQNVLYKIKSMDVYRSQITKRFDIVTGLLISVDFDEKSASGSASMLNMANLYGVDYLISTFQIDDTNGILKQGQLDTTPAFHIYRFENTRPDEYLTTNLIQTPTLNTLKEYLQNPLDPNKNPVFIDRNIYLSSKIEPRGSIQNIKNTNSYKKYHINTDTKALLVVNQSYDENWQAKLNGTTQRIFPVNINQLGLVVVPGSFDLELKYSPKGWIWAKWLTYSFLFIICLCMFLQLFKRDRRITK